MSEVKKLALSIAIIVGALLLFGVWLFLGIREQGNLEESVAAKRGEQQNLRDKVSQIPVLRQEKQKLEGEVHEYEMILPKYREQDNVFDSITQFEEESGLRILALNPEREARDTGQQDASSYKKISYRVDVIGDFFQIAKFVNLLEHWDRFVQVDSFSIKSKDEDTLINDATLKISTFVYDPKSAPKRKPTRATASAKTVAKTATTSSDAPFDIREALENRYVFSRDKYGKNRRDPFSNPLTRTQTASRGIRSKPGPVAHQSMTSDQEVQLCEHVEGQLKEMEQLLNKGDFDKATEIYWGLQEGLTHRYDDANARRRILDSRRKVGRLEVMLKEAKGEQLYKLVQGHYAQMEKAFENQAYEEVRKLNQTVQEVVKKADQDFVHERLPDLLASCGELCERAGKRAEFEQIGIEIQGTFWSGTGSEKRAAAIVNGQVLVEGERLRMNDGGKTATKGPAKTAPARTSPADAAEPVVIVKRIEREKITFLYKNEEIVKLHFIEY